MTLGGLSHRARIGHDFLIRRSGRVVKNRPVRSVRWADIPRLSTRAGVVRRVGSSIGSSHELLAVEDLVSGLSSGGLLASPSRWISLSTARAATASPTRVNR